MRRRRNAGPFRTPDGASLPDARVEHVRGMGRPAHRGWRMRSPERPCRQVAARFQPSPPARVTLPRQQHADRRYPSHCLLEHPLPERRICSQSLRAGPDASAVRRWPSRARGSARSSPPPIVIMMSAVHLRELISWPECTIAEITDSSGTALTRSTAASTAAITASRARRPVSANLRIAHDSCSNALMIPSHQSISSAVDMPSNPRYASRFAAASGRANSASRSISPRPTMLVKQLSRVGPEHGRPLVSHDARPRSGASNARRSSRCSSPSFCITVSPMISSPGVPPRQRS